jgi:putative transcriptional regulator
MNSMSQFASANPALDDLLTQHAAGTLSAAEAFLANVHLAMSPASRNVFERYEVLGGAMLEALEPAPLTTPGLPARDAEGPVSPTPIADVESIAAMIAFVRANPDGVRWKRRLFGPREMRLPIRNLFLFRLDPGERAPAHGHHGRETTLVLTGRFKDESGEHGPGDVTSVDQSVMHRPTGIGEAPCVCLAATEGGYRAIAPWSKIHFAN